MIGITCIITSILLVALTNNFKVQSDQGLIHVEAQNQNNNIETDIDYHSKSRENINTNTNITINRDDNVKFQWDPSIPFANEFTLLGGRTTRNKQLNPWLSSIGLNFITTPIFTITFRILSFGMYKGYSAGIGMGVISLNSKMKPSITTFNEQTIGYYVRPESKQAAIYADGDYATPLKSDLYFGQGEQLKMTVNQSKMEITWTISNGKTMITKFPPSLYGKALSVIVTMNARGDCIEVY